MNRSQFIEEVGAAATEVMVQTGLLASITVAQALLEGGDGKGGFSTLATEAKNIFGIKGTGTAGSYSAKTREVLNGVSQTVTASFRKYHTWAESIADRTDLLLNAKRSDGSFRYRHLVGVTDPVTAARLIYKAGYATDAPAEVDGDPAYDEKLVSIIRSNNLTRFDDDALQIMVVPDWARGSRELLMKWNVTDGTRPNEPVTRAEVWTMLNRLWWAIEENRKGDSQ